MAGSGISPDDAGELLRRHVKSEGLIRHSLATAAIMADLAVKMNEPSPETWEATGLLHDLDMEITGDDYARHGLVAAKMLGGVLPAEFIHAIKAHNGKLNGTVRTTELDFLLSAAESVTGLISATALIHPDRSLGSVSPASVMKRMGKTGFARNVDRARIEECAEAGWELEEFVTLALNAMKRIAPEIGL